MGSASDSLKKQRDDVHRLNARLAGKDARRQREWWRKRYADPEFRAAELERQRRKYQRPEYPLARKLGIGVQAARALLEDTA